MNSRAARDGNPIESRPEVRGDAGVLEHVAEAFGTARRVATLAVVFPDA